MLNVVLTQDPENDDSSFEGSFSASVQVNGNVVVARSCRRTDRTDEDGRSIYKVDDGSEVAHYREDGAVELAKKLLNTVEEPTIDLDIEEVIE